MHRRFPCSSGPDSTQSTHHEVNGHSVWKHDTPAIIIVDITRPHWPCSLDQGTAGFYAHTPGTTAAWSHLRCRVGHTGGGRHHASITLRPYHNDGFPCSSNAMRASPCNFPTRRTDGMLTLLAPLFLFGMMPTRRRPSNTQDCSRKGTTKHLMLLLTATPLGSCKVTCCGYPLMPRRRPEELPSTV